MFLARAVATCEDELICDLAETYHVFNWRGLPLKTAATLAFGLSRDSRTKIKIYGNYISDDKILLARIFDQLQILRWYQSADGVKGENPPEMLTDELLGIKRTTSRRVTAFASAEDFEQRRQQIIGGQNG